jgi:UDP-4-keto-D-QuiNAc 4-reductase
MASCTLLLTGANGFVGTSVLELAAARASFSVRGVVRAPVTAQVQGVEYVCVPTGLAPETDWRAPLSGADVVVHAAARVHVLNDRSLDPLGDYRRANVAGTLQLASQAADVGVKRFVFLSSIKVNGEQTAADARFRADDLPAPSDPYAISKYEAERALFDLGERRGIEIVVIRPPLVVGPGVRANFLTMMRWVSKGLPLPFGLVRNRRSLVATRNLADLILCCATHPAAAGQVFLVSDGEDLSTPELLRRVGIALGRPAKLVPVPPALIAAAATAVGRGALARRLLSSLEVDLPPTRQTLGWQPIVGVDDGIRAAAAGFWKAVE